jgi:hypothetical protein
VDPDGSVRTHLTLSEIAFDSRHEQAAFVFPHTAGVNATAVARLFMN